MAEPIYPDLVVPVNDGPDGNAMMIVANLRRGLQHRHVSADKISKIITEALSRNYEHVLQTVGKYATLDYS